MQSIRGGMRLTSRRGAVIASSAAVLCLGSLLAACGGESGPDDDGYVAVGAVGPRGEGTSGTTRTVSPEGEVTLVPLEGTGRGAGARSEPGRGRTTGSGAPETDASPPGNGGRGPANDAAGDGRSPAATGSEGRTDAGQGAGPASGPGAGSASGPGQGPGPASGPGSVDEPSSPAPADPEADPAELSIGPIERAPAEDRWCEKVTLELHNSGDKPVTSGKVTFSTHIIGALGIDWATIESTRELPVPIGGGERTEKTWAVCVAAWRVPLGMHVETQDADVTWSG
ncbi:hypothetical protein AB0C51_05910 [Streptomyces pathocidini]|uniref:hypothetical protein n=1 Tax=Streptomyces pathocidini TaxID=1650571 RepID=UPI0033ED4ABB